jgi:hypothetical protein
VPKENPLVAASQAARDHRRGVFPNIPLPGAAHEPPGIFFMNICYNGVLTPLPFTGENMRKDFSVTLALILVSLVYACNGSSPAAAPANALFSDNFTQTDGGWTQVRDTNGTSGYIDGHFRISVIPKATQIISNPGRSFAGDVSIQVDAQNTGEAGVSYAGVVCHYQDADNYYMFLVTSDGTAAIIMNKGGVFSNITPSAKFLPMKGIKTGKTTNHLQADCVGDKLTLYANGKQVSLSYDKSLTGGDVGLVVRSSSDQGGAEITFDNFVVTLP